MENTQNSTLLEEIKILKEKIIILEKELKELRSKYQNHRHDGHGYAVA